MDLIGSFIGFTYNGIHSSLLGIVRYTSSNRMEEKLAPTMKDNTLEKVGAGGSLYFGSLHIKREFTINFAYQGMTEENKHLMTQFWVDGKIHELIFDETPYKVYMAKVTGTSTLKEIPFSTNGKRTYNGEGSIVFTCMMPYAKSRFNFIEDYNADNIHTWAKQENLSILREDAFQNKRENCEYATVVLDEFNEDGSFGLDSINAVYGEFETYEQNTALATKKVVEEGESNIVEWLVSSDLPSNEQFGHLINQECHIYNAGDLPISFKAWYRTPSYSDQNPNFGIRIYNDEEISDLSTENLTYETFINSPEIYYIVLDTNNYTLEGYTAEKKATGKLFNRYLTPTQNFSLLQRGENILTFTGQMPIQLDYNYLYY